MKPLSLSVVAGGSALLLLAFACSGTDAAGVADAPEGGAQISSSSSSGGPPGPPGTTTRDAAAEGSADTGAPAPSTCDPTKNECANGGVCTDVASSGYACRAPCANETACAKTAKTSCVLLGPGRGACIPTCTPFAGECPAGMSCTTHAPEASGVTQTSTSAFCRKVGTLAVGALCESDPTGCVADAECIFFPPEGVAQSKCVAVCDGKHACAAGTCVIRQGESFGYCKP